MNDVSSFPWKSTFLSECNGFVKVHHFLPTYDYMSSNFKILCLKCYTLILMSMKTKSDICQTHSILKILFCFPLSAGHEDLIFSIFCIHFWALSVEYCCIEFVDHIFSDHTNIFCLKSGFLVCSCPIPKNISPLTDFGLNFPGSHHPDLLPFYQFTLQHISKSFLL